MTASQLQLVDYLKTLTVNELKNICRHYGIKNYSSKKKDALITLINTEVLQSETIKTAIKNDPIYQPFKNETSVKMTLPETHYFLYENAKNEVAMPMDLKQSVFTQIHPESEKMDLTLFYRAVLNYYGYVSYDALQKLALMNDLHKSKDDIKQDLLTLFNDMHDFIDEQGARHPHFDHFKLDLDAAKNTPIVLPERIESLLSYQTMTMIKATDNVNKLRYFIESNLFTGKPIIADEIIREMRLSEDASRVEDYVRRLIKARRLKKLPLAKYMQVITPVHEEVPIWTLGGGYIEKKTIDKQHINKKVVKKSKKRKKGKNISRLK